MTSAFVIQPSWAIGIPDLICAECFMYQYLFPDHKERAIKIREIHNKSCSNSSRNGTISIYWKRDDGKPV